MTVQYGAHVSPVVVSPMAVPDRLTDYASQSPITDPGGRAALLDGLPEEVAALVRVVGGLVLHPTAASKLGVDLPPERRSELNLRRVARMLERILELDPRRLAEPRPPERRLIGNCRDAAVLLCAILRHQGRPARARAGFATYLAPDFFTDQWSCERWDGEAARWLAVDPGFPADPALFGFDTLDVPADRFLVAGRAWRLCRQGGVDPARFGFARAARQERVGLDRQPARARSGLAQQARAALLGQLGARTQRLRRPLRRGRLAPGRGRERDDR
jgi:hypothetical protein